MRNLIFKFLLKYIYIPLYRLSLKFEFNKIKKLIKLQSFAFRGLLYRIRNLKDFKIYGNNSKNDNLVFFTITNILKIKLNDSNKIKFEEIKPEVMILKDEVLSDPKSRKLINIYSQIQIIVDKRLKKSDCEYEDLILDKEIFTHKISLDNLEATKNIIKDLSKNEFNEVLDKSSFKLDFKISSLVTAIGLITPLIFIGGYFSNKIYYNSFNTNLHEYFSLRDYVAIGVEEIETAILSAIITLLAFFYMMHVCSRTVNNPSSSEKKMNIYDILFFTLFIVLTVYFFYKNIPEKFFMLQAISVFLVFEISSKVAKKFFAQPMKAILFLIIIFIFLSNIIISSYAKVFRFKLDVSNRIKIYDLEFNNSYFSNLKDYYIIGYNSKYVFMTDSLFIKTTVIDRNSIIKTEINECN